MATDEDLLNQISRILELFELVKGSWTESRFPHFDDKVALNSLQAQCSALAETIYGPGHPQAERIHSAICGITLSHIQAAEGMIRGAADSIRHGLLSKLHTQILLDVQTDFIEAAREALSNNSKDVAAALLCVVLEDSCKRLGQKAKIDNVEGLEFSRVVVSLFTSGVISKSTKGQLLSFSDLRNSALHAQWSEVSTETTQGLLYFLPSFLEQHGI